MNYQHLDVICVLFGIRKIVWSILKYVKTLDKGLKSDLPSFITVGTVNGLNFIQCVMKPVKIGD